MQEEQNRNKLAQQSTREEEMELTPSRWKKMIKKKWFFPAIYLASAALILALIMWYQNPNDFALDPIPLESGIPQGVEENADLASMEMNVELEEAVPVTAEAEEMIWPYAQEGNVQLVLGFFDDNSSHESQLQAMVEYERSFHPHQGMDFAQIDGEAFEVVAALSGTVRAVDKEPLIGNYIEIEHEQGLVTVYQSLGEVKVAQGDQVQQGDPIAQAGRNVFEQSLGIHLHFEVRKDGLALNPEQFLVQTTAESN